MKTGDKLMEMLTGYAVAHQHPVNIFVHLIGIPAIMLGVLIPLTWIAVEIGDFRVSVAYAVVLGFFLFYLTLDRIFAIAFVIGGWLLLMLAIKLSSLPGNTGWIIAAACFFGGYAAQFIGHAVEKSMPVLVRHPIQANLAAPFFTVVEVFKLAGLRNELFDEIRARIDLQQQEQES